MATSSKEDYIKNHPLMAQPSPEECIIRSGEQVRFTAKGRAHYQAQFGKVGIDISQIKTMEQYNHALDASWPVALAELAQFVADYPSHSIEKACLLALLIGDMPEFERLRGLLERRNLRWGKPDRA